MYKYHCPDCNEAKIKSDRNARKINEVIDQVNALIQVNNGTVDFIEEKADEIVGEIAETKVNEILDDLNTEINNIITSLDSKANEDEINAEIDNIRTSLDNKANEDEITAEIDNILTSLDSKANEDEITAEIDNINQSINQTNNKLSAIAPPNIIYMDSFGELTDYSDKLRELVDSANNVEIRFSNKEYIFSSKVTITKKVRLIGSNTTFRWQGTGRFLEYVNAPWMIEGCMIKDISFWGRGQDVGQDIMIYSESPNVMMTIDNCQFYDCYCFLRFHTQSFGHTIKDCSFWGFTTAMNCTGNAEQITVDHCWFDDGKRTEGSQNAVIRVEDATSFWITRTVIQNADIGVTFKGVRNGTVRDCHFENMIDSSIWLNSNAQYENRNCVIDCNYLVGGRRAIYFYKGSQNNVHNTICNNYIAFLGVNCTSAIQGNQADACGYTAFYNNSIAPDYTHNPLLSDTVVTNKIQNFQ